MKIIIGFVMATSMALLAAPMAYARGGGGGFHGGGGGGGYRGGGGGGAYHGGGGGGAYHGGGEGYHGGGEGYHGGEGGFHSGEANGFHSGGFEAGTYHGGGYSAGHVGLPTDGGFGHGGYVGGRGGTYAAAGHHTFNVSGSVATARGATVRNNFNHYDAFGHGWYGDHPGAWHPHGWGPWHGWYPATWFGLGAWCGWGSLQPVYYDYGDNITYVNNEVYYGDQPVSTAEAYYNGALALAQTAPRRTPTPTGCPWASSPWCRATRPTPAWCFSWR